MEGEQVDIIASQMFFNLLEALDFVEVFVEVGVADRPCWFLGFSSAAFFAGSIQ
jgi:hypothetical protein